MKEEKTRPRTRKERKQPPVASPMAHDVMELAGYLVPVANFTLEYLAGRRMKKPRKTNLLPEVEHCTNPKVIGGGKAAGVLWNMWDKMQTVKSGPLSEGNEELIALAHQALIPHEKWRNVANRCILHNLEQSDIHSTGRVPPYLALHAR
ncbi:MAG: hypothetical protein SGILL_006653, partial [Bacillariaceae sp.]